MYLRFFSLREDPFNVTPDPAFIFLGESHKEALGTIVYGVERHKGLMAVTGGIGMGKTTVVRYYLDRRAGSRIRVVYLYNPHLTFRELLASLADSLGQSSSGEEIDLLRRIYRVLIEENRKDRAVALIIDEAQGLPMKTFERLRVLSNLETPKAKLLQIVLVGQPELDGILEREELRPLRQRIVARTVLRPLTNEESLAYVQHRLAVAGVDDPDTVFASRALRRIIREARGVPRRLNVICSSALAMGYALQTRPVTARVVRQCLREEAGPSRLRLSRPAAAATLMAAVLVILLAALGPRRAQQVAEQPLSSPPAFKDHAAASGHAAPATAGVPPAPPAPPAPRIDTEGSTMTVQLFPVSEEPDPVAPARPAEAPKAEHQVAGRSGHLPPAAPRPAPALPARPTEQVQSSLPDRSYPVTRQVEGGDMLWTLCAEVYGACNDRLLDLIVARNPGIMNVNRIQTGDIIVFPDPKVLLEGARKAGGATRTEEKRDGNQAGKADARPQIRTRWSPTMGIR